MAVKKQSPLSKRYIRDLRSDFGKYAVIFLLLTLSIGFSSGYIVAGDSMVKAYNESFSKYNIEHGHFSTQNTLSRSKKRAISDLGANVYEIFYKEKEVKDHGILRIFAERKEINLVCLMSGNLPEAADEMAIDRMYAVNNKLEIGDTIELDGSRFVISGLIALPDYSALFQDNDDMMFDASLFGTAVVTKEAFDSFVNPKYCYAWKYQMFDGSKSEKELADDFMKNRSPLQMTFAPSTLYQGFHSSRCANICFVAASISVVCIRPLTNSTIILPILASTCCEPTK